MARKSFKADAPRKSPWLGKGGKKPEKVLKPMFPLAKGSIMCPSCRNIRDVEAHSEVVVEYPREKFWYTGYCTGQVLPIDKNLKPSTCGTLIAGWAVFREYEN